jgi:hypothetical protein
VNPGEVGLALIAEGEVNLNGGSEITGLVMSGTSWKMNGNSSITGAVVINDRCNEGALFNGTMDLIYGGPVSTPFDGTTTSGGTLSLLGSREL